VIRSPYSPKNQLHGRATDRNDGYGSREPIKMPDINIQYYKANDLIMAEYNPRQLTKDQYAQLKDSLTRFGLVDPLIVNKHKSRKNILVGGHQRLKIAKEMGMDKIPCVEVDLPLDQEKELNIRLNKNVGEWDYDSLANYFDVSELMEWGFSNDELQFYEDEPEQGLIDDDEIPEVEEAITKSGDIWLLGEHRVLCGDATKKEDVERLMEGKKADICFTSPPYNAGSLNIKGNKTTQPKYTKFDDNDYDWYEMVKSSILNMIINSTEVFYNIGLVQNNKVDLMRLPVDLSDIFKDIIYWKKDTAAPHIQPGVINNKVEMVLCFGNDKRSFENAQFKQGTYWNVIEGPNASGNEYADIHKATFPIYFPENIIVNFCHPSGSVIDCFLGSGSTLIACEKTKRKCYGMEIDPHYCDVIVKRWEEFTGNKAERVERAEC
jgi:DNA modification methylase